MLTKSAVLRVHRLLSSPLRGARPQGHRFRPSSDGCCHLTTLSPTCSPCRPFGPVQEITCSYALSLDNIDVFIWDSLPNQGRDDPIAIALGSPTNEELRYWVTSRRFALGEKGGRLIIRGSGGRQLRPAHHIHTLATNPFYPWYGGPNCHSAHSK
jgi:hypothetical protein